MVEKKKVVGNKPRKTATSASQKRGKEAAASTETTKRKRLEKELAESDEWHRALVETAGKAGYGITILQNTPEQEAAVIFANSEATRILGFSQEEALGMSAWDFFEPSELAEIQQRYIQRQKGQQVNSHYEAALLHKDGRRIPVEASLSLMNYQGKAATVIHFEDITERKRVEKELNRHRNQLEELVEERTAELQRINEQLQQEITERKQVELALQQSEEYHRSLIENALDAIVILNEDLSVRYESPAFERILGYKLEERVGKNAFELTHPDDVPEAFNALVRLLQDPDFAPHFEVRGLHKDGSWRTLEAICKSLIDNHVVKGIVVNVRDVTERKQTEEKLLASEKYFRCLLENASDAIIILDSDGTPRYLSPSYESVLGYKPEDPVGRAVFELIHPDDLPTALAQFNESLQNPGSIQHIEVRGRHKDGSWHTLDVTGRNLLDDPIVKGIVVNYRDITERKQADEKLLASEKYFRYLIENASDAISILDRDGTMRYESPAFEHILGHKLEDRLGGGPFDLVHLDDIPKAAATFTDLLQNPGSVRQVEVRGRHKDGSWRTLEVIARNLLDDPLVKGLVANYRDITERKQAEEKLQQLYEEEKDLRQQLEAEMKRRVEFTRALAHELKTPLTPMLISSQVLASELKKGPLLSLARNINKGALNLNSRIDELLDVAKGEIGLLHLQPQTLDIVPLLKEVAEYVTPLASKRRQSLVLELPDSLPLIKADKGRVRQVLMNLLNNAFKFTPDGGKITLRALNKHDSLVIEVEDNGPGIERKGQQHLFEPYHPMGVDEEHLSSLGLGLALCKMLVQLHGGQIWAKSQPGKGSTFGFSLPLEATNNEGKGSESGEIV